jgi:putative ABC transport system substrate-binding protein
VTTPAIILLATLVIASLYSPLHADARQAKDKHRVALVFFATRLSDMAGPEPAERLARVFIHALRDLGYVEGRNLVLERRSLEGRPERASAVVAELVRLQVDVIVSTSNPITRAAKDATTSIPIVMVANAAPVQQGLIASLARPGGNVTGLGYDPGAEEIDAKRLELLKEVVPGMSRVAFLGNKLSWELPAAQRAQAAARALGLTLFHAELAADDVASAFSVVARGRADAILVSGGPATYAQRRRIIEFAAQNRLPASYGVRDAVEDGGFMSYGVSATDLFQRAATYVDKLLKGAKPGELPVEQPTKFELLINLKTAQSLGLTVPQPLLLRADELIR